MGSKASRQMDGAERPDRKSALEERAFDARVEMLYRRNNAPILMGLGFGLLVCAFNWNIFSHELVLGWFAFKLFTASIRLGLSQLYERESIRKKRSSAQWAWMYVLLLVVDGFAWSLVGILFAPADRVDLVSAAIASIVGIAAVGTAVLSPFLPGHIAFSFALILPAAFWQLYHGHGQIGTFAGIAALIFLALITADARRASRSTIELIRLRFKMTELAEERARALQEAQHSSKVKSQFVATMSHELRTPLHGILGLVRLMRETQQDSTTSGHLELVEQSGEHLLTLINDVLDFSKIESGHIEITMGPFDIVQLLEEVIALSGPAAREKALQLHLRSSLPRPTWIMGDLSRTRQIIINLVGNAIKFTEKGSVSVDFEDVDGSGIIRVIDTGPGIATDELSLIFDPFHQADQAPNRRFMGTGLGLSIARDLARAMNGDVTCSSEPGRGSTFTFRFPLHLTASARRAEESATLPRLKGQILLAEDNAVSAILAQTMLRPLGVQVIVAGDGEQTVQAYEKSRPDIILMDCHMPGTDGFEATRMIRDIEAKWGFPRVPIIALTADAFRDSQERCMLSGMDDFLSKPFRKQDLWELLARYLPQE